MTQIHDTTPTPSTATIGEGTRFDLALRAAREEGVFDPTSPWAERARNTPIAGFEARA